ncbi:MAG: hypothetical protein ABWX73_05745 [Marmoricola sp.]
MSRPTTPGAPPPEVPEEFAAAYRAAYEQALAAQTDWPQHREFPDEPVEVDPAEDAAADEAAEPDLPRRRGPLRVGTHRIQEEYDDDAPTWFERIRDSRWFVPLLLALLASLLILGAYAVGRRFADRVAADGDPGAEPTLVIGDGSAQGQQAVTHQKPGAGAWAGNVVRLGGVKATAGCTSKSGEDAGGDTVAYDAGNLTDGVADTTWRCDGSAVGERITLDLGREVAIGQVGLIPGYAKTDEQSKADRFAENNRITRVRWTIGDLEVVQKFSGRPDDRNLQLVRVPRTTTDTIEVKILSVAQGPRDTTAISEIHVARVAGS